MEATQAEQLKEGVFMKEEKKQKNTDALSQIVEMSLLYDFYGGLLKEHKRSIFEDYVLNDYSGRKGNVFARNK